MQKQDRLISLDVFRGITIAGMVLVNNPGSWEHIYAPLEHAEWNGCTPTDLVFPFFLFIVGVAITLSLTKRKDSGDNQTKLILNIFRRSAILFLLGLFLNGFPEFNFESIRIPGVLQRIAVVYLITSLLFLKTKLNTQIFLTVFFLVFYWFLMTFIPVPGIGPANYNVETNLAAWLDSKILMDHMWSVTMTWDPEGILSTIPAISTSLIGVLAGHWLKNTDKQKVTIGLFVASSILMFLGYVWNGWFPMNKSIWTSSYVLYVGGLALNFLAICYWLIDVKKITWWIKPFQVYGMNAITVFFLSGVVGRLLYLIKVYDESGNKISISEYAFNNYFLSWLEPINASLLWAIVYVLIWLGLMWILYAKKIFIKV
ncbi:MAG: DUF5009 domain-containing protein [Ignavibacteriales bacterium]|nr:DUF5009 domain-containing protein [Ignavibacteriales bacterium]